MAELFKRRARLRRRARGGVGALPLTVAILAASCAPAVPAAPTSTSVAVTDAAATPAALMLTPIYDASGYDPDPGRGFVPLDDPGFIPGASADHLAPDEFVLGVEWNGEARAYPVGMMAWHHIANDQVRGSPILVTY